MKRSFSFLRWTWIVWAVLLLLVPACSKYVDVRDHQYGDPGDVDGDLAIGTLRSRNGIRYIRLDDLSVGMIVNPERLEEYPDETRVYIRYRCVVIGSSVPDFCTDAILVEWVMPLEMGEVSLDRLTRQGDPLSVRRNWMTSFDDGFLTVNYSFPSSGENHHGFLLCPGEKKNEFRLIHDANGDTDGRLRSGLIYFDVASMLPDTGGETVTLSLTYLELDNTLKTLTFDYRSPQ